MEKMSMALCFLNKNGTPTVVRDLDATYNNDDMNVNEEYLDEITKVFLEHIKIKIEYNLIRDMITDVNNNRLKEINLVKEFNELQENCKDKKTIGILERIRPIIDELNIS